MQKNAMNKPEAKIKSKELKKAKKAAKLAAKIQQT